MTSLPAQVSMLFNQGVWTPRGTFWIVACYRNLSDHIAKFLCPPYERYYNLIHSALHHYHPNALHQLFYCILRSINYNKPTSFTLQKCGWSLEYQFLSVQNEPWTSFPQEPAARSTPAYLTSNITLGIQKSQSVKWGRRLTRSASRRPSVWPHRWAL